MRTRAFPRASRRVPDRVSGHMAGRVSGGVFRGVMRPALRAIAALLLGAAGAGAAAHDFHMGIADISYNERTGSTEIVHTFTAHDVAALLANLYQRDFDLGQDETEAPLRRYVEQQFYLAAPDGARLPLRWVGFRADADSVTVYQEVAQTRLAPASRIHDALLIDFLATQKNTVNVQLGDKLQTLIFERGNIEQTAR